MIYDINDLIKIVDEKLNISKDEKETEKLKKLKSLFNVPGSFFRINMNVALNILIDLGLSEEDSKKTYMNLISPDSFQNMPKIREIVSDKNK